MYLPWRTKNGRSAATHGGMTEWVFKIYARGSSGLNKSSQFRANAFQNFIFLRPPSGPLVSIDSPSKVIPYRRPCFRLWALGVSLTSSIVIKKCQLATLQFKGVILRWLRPRVWMKGAIPEATHHPPQPPLESANSCRRVCPEGSTPPSTHFFHLFLNFYERFRILNF